MVTNQVRTTVHDQCLVVPYVYDRPEGGEFVLTGTHDIDQGIFLEIFI